MLKRLILALATERQTCLPYDSRRQGRRVLYAPVALWLMLLAASPAWAVTWGHAHGVIGQSTSPYTLTLGFTPAAGSILAVACAESGTTALSISDNSSGPADVWTSVASFYWLNSSSYPLTAWATVVTSGIAPTTVTCTGGSGSHVGILVDNYTGGPSIINQDGSAATNYTTSTSESLSCSYTTGSAAGDLLWSAAYNDGGVSLSVASPFTARESSTSYDGANTSDDGISAGVAANTQATATYSSAYSLDIGCFVVGFKASGHHSYTATPSESNTASDAISRLAGFARADSESNTAFDWLARSEGSFRSASEALIVSDSLGRVFNALRGGTEHLSASDSAGRVLGAVRSDVEALIVSDTVFGFHREIPARHMFLVPGQAKSGILPGQVKAGSEAGREKSGTAPVH